MAISSVRAPSIPWAAKCRSAAARIRRATAGSSTLLRPRAIIVSDPQTAHVFLRISRSDGRPSGRHLVDPPQVSGAERNPEGPEILVEVRAPLCARNGHDVFALREHPGQSQLRWSAMLFLGDLFNARDQFQVLLEVLALKARRHAPEILGAKFRTLHLAGEDAATERAVGDKSNPQLAAGRKDPALGIAGPQRVFALKRRDRAGRMSPAYGCDARFRQPQVAHLALIDQSAHGADGILDRNTGIHAVQIKQIDGRNLQALQTRLTGALHIF